MIPEIDLILMLAGAGVVSGFLAGLLGIGGGIVTIPVQFIIYNQLGFPQEWVMHIAIATSLGIIVATNISSVIAHHKKESVDWKVIKDWWWMLAIGAILGAHFATTLKTAMLVYIFAGLGFSLALKMLLPLDHIKLGDALPTRRPRLLPPFMIGFLSAVMGIGGGSFSVPYMTLYSVPIQKAVGTAALAGLVISVGGGLGYVVSGFSVPGLPQGTLGFLHMPSLIIIASAAVILAPLGAKVAHKLSKRALSIVFGLFIIVAVTRLILAV
ncbi:sulfite exporter TauE/SafE family protein [Temperatibacter marinus]|uniref:Probable membrane transporter protein n=1 Tax=Temperatibacter marinus TaxID=1456591 RepID=A0AA52EFZ9_9PROT|nr:sulfite exporter TauE/SafE family protein [Temperatibacter marinus]WND02125.1 sulfite exporter TauE/SafE family protein [Temperatibacter marinus]